MNKIFKVLLELCDVFIYNYCKKQNLNKYINTMIIIWQIMKKNKYKCENNFYYFLYNNLYNSFDSQNNNLIVIKEFEKYLKDNYSEKFLFVNYFFDDSNYYYYLMLDYLIPRFLDRLNYFYDMEKISWQPLFLMLMLF